MKKHLILMLLAFSLFANAQQEKKEIKILDLSAPNSPAFTLTDLSPTLVENPATPKAFVLGIAQSFGQTKNGFPDNYAVGFTPYWWIKKEGYSVYNYIGLLRNNGDQNGEVKEDVFSGIKFVNLSIAFVNKDLIPDDAMDQQQIFSFGARTTLLKGHRKGYAKEVDQAIKTWTTAANKAFITNKEIRLQIALHPEKSAELLKNWDYSDQEPSMDNLNMLFAEKPIIKVDLSAAHAIYGIDDKQYKSGRTGVWTTISSYFPIGYVNNKPNNSYFNFNGSIRYQEDHFSKSDDGNIGLNRSLDAGGKFALEINDFSIGVEWLHRWNNAEFGNQNRTVGLINYRIADGIFLNGSFGKNFDVPNKLITALSINWGIGKEKIRTSN
ncbi:hypothetical protein [Pedobacter mucosus]|uniref:hypothetical protein n=1 Tax=Pedobacter mucosus TaxID=2895286 RepID=UPI001EE49046|nr:hypothetical protein [Pedobacter mucosus]UKT65385.1 hypothetical protein LOK61_06275 [Pedobacter mucosus]